jgi:hypothetical protein
MSVGIPDNMSDIMVSYGRDNSGQAYGGGIIYGNRYMDKPCFLDIINHDTHVGILYIYFNGSVVTYYRESGNAVFRVIIYGR